MSTKPQIELFLENENGTQQVAYPFVESDHVSLTNGMDIDTMIRQDVSMPTVTHEDLSFKVGVGDQDVSSAIVDSSVAEMTIKGKTYQNILPEPSTHVLTNNKEMFKVNEGLDPNVEIVDGVSKSAILKGQTLINLSPIRNKILSRLDGYGPSIALPIKLFKSNVYYIAFMDIGYVENATSTLHFQWKDNNQQKFNVIADNASTLANTKVAFKFKQTLVNPTALSLTINSANPMDCKIEINNFMVIEYQEGMENWDIPYFEGMQSVKMPVLTTVGKNLVIKPQHGYVSNGVINTSVKSWINSDYIYVKGLKEVVGSTSNVINGSTNIATYNKNKELIRALNGKSQATLNDDEYYVIFSRRKLDNSEITQEELLNSQMQLEIGSTPTTYEPYKTNILTTSEEVELRGIGEVKDELDLLTGELTQRVEEIVLDGSENWNEYTLYGIDGYTAFITTIPSLNNLYHDTDKIFISADFPVGTWEDYRNNLIPELVWNHDPNKIGIRVKSEKASTVKEIKEFLSTNNIRINYELVTESIKTVDLSSSGNWEKVVLDGSEDESWFSNFTDLGDGYYRFQGNLSMLKNPYKNENNYGMGFSDSFKWSTSWTGKSEGFYFNSMIVIRILGSKLPSLSIEGCMQYLQQNPLTIYYLTATHQDSTQVKQPIFCKNGHIQLSSGADNSLIPTLDYQAKTSNSYVMDLMKTNTKYTMKAKSANGTFTIDGTSYGAGTNGTFTTPSSMTNKFLVMSNNANEEIMILEGDVTDKTIPYFKGIKSAFEDEDKIEVLSTGKNLLDPSKFCGDERWLTLNNDQTISISQTASGAWYYLYKDLKIPTNTYITLEVLEGTYEGGNVGLFRNGELLKELWWGDGGKKVHTYNQVYDELKIWSIRGNCKVRISITETEADYEPYKSNTTKIPLLSPLRSLPDGTCDELIIDRMKKKATLIQRIKTVTLDGSSDETWTGYNDGGTRVTQGFSHNVSDSVIDRVNVNLYCDTLQPNINAIHSRDGRGVGMHNDGSNNRNIRLCLLKNELIPYGFSEPSKTNENVLRKWLQDNPTTVYYQLETPVITEVDLEGFPYIYKDGHIFLNGEITPVTEIKYSINQQHQIEASNQDLIRHQKEIDYLYRLIGEYVRVDYKNTLLSLNLELK